MPLNASYTAMYLNLQRYILKIPVNIQGKQIDCFVVFRSRFLWQISSVPNYQREHLSKILNVVSYVPRSFYGLLIKEIIFVS